MGDETVEGLRDVRKGEVDVESDGAELLLNGSEGGVGVLENESADEKRRTLRMGGAGSGDERL